MSGCICNDCRIDTTPRTGKRGYRSGKHTGQYAYRRKNDLWEYYMVTVEVWKAAGMPASTADYHTEFGGDFLCIGCLELRIGRRLTARDFTDCLVNVPNLGDTPRLRDRMARGRSAGEILSLAASLKSKGTLNGQPLDPGVTLAVEVYDRLESCSDYDEKYGELLCDIVETYNRDMGAALAAIRSGELSWELTATGDRYRLLR